MCDHHDDRPAGGTACGAVSRRFALRGGLAAAALAGGLDVSGGRALAASAPSGADAELITLGTLAGPVSTANRTGISSALHVRGRTYLVDCGLGSLHQFSRAGLALDSLAAMFVTHLHADHVADYFNYFLIGGSGIRHDRKVRVCGPGPAGGLPDAFWHGPAETVGDGDPTPGIAELTRRCAEAYAYSANIFQRSSRAPAPQDLADVHEIALPEVGASFRNTAPDMDPFPVWEDDEVRVSAVLVPHYDVFPSFAYRFDLAGGRSVVFSGDTRKHDNVARLAAGCDVLVHESVYVKAIPPGRNPNPDYWRLSHTFPEEVGQIATAAGARHVVLSHISPGDVPDDRWRAAVGSTYRGPVTVAADLQRFPL
ncbi:MBL fold metallo-hydrolase [Saccharopolyspora rosea]|uniref:MBL fold metallo-hydrolase n=1 Tax=Saccharopolyspora rosea TaxID=524884 RepID=A0ABW3FXI0_9PSEU|nr:MBL fold metallo-hydrolase [Saccharopolyspora rosea]